VEPVGQRTCHRLGRQSHETAQKEGDHHRKGVFQTDPQGRKEQARFERSSKFPQG
jgi:hypothetical protein